MKDTRIAYGVNCSWWDSIYKVGHDGVMPCCPHCKGLLFEVDSEETWYIGVDLYTTESDPRYRKFIEWLRGKCFKGGYSEARATWDKLQ